MFIRYLKTCLIDINASERRLCIKKVCISIMNWKIICDTLKKMPNAGWLKKKREKIWLKKKKEKTTLRHFSKCLLLWSTEKCIYTVWNYIRLRKWQNVYLSENCPFKMKKVIGSTMIIPQSRFYIAYSSLAPTEQLPLRWMEMLTDSFLQVLWT